MYNRRQFFGALGKPAAAAMIAGTFNFKSIRPTLKKLEDFSGTPEELASDESFWFIVQQAFSIDRSVINFNNGGVCPSPDIVVEAYKDYWDFENKAPSYTMWSVLEPQKELVRKRLARMFVCDPEEVALTRNASEGMEICQFGIDMEPGDEMLTTNQDYGRMITTFRQRERRDKVFLKQFSIPTPAEDPDELVSLFEQNITPRTKMILMCHVINLTGQIMPVKKVVQMARKRGIPVLVDGAHGFAHFDFDHTDLDCDFYATSLHKWLCAPHGTGLLYVRKDKIKDIWPLMAAPERMDNNIRKFEEIGTHPAAPYLGIADAITFHEGIGAKRKEARLRYLRNRWAHRLMQHDRIVLNTSLKPEFSCGVSNVRIKGVDTRKLVTHLWEKHKIIVVPIIHEEYEGIRVTPNVYTTLDEIDIFCEAMEDVIKNGL